MITAEQMRAARALLRMEQAKLSELSGVSLPTIKRLETTSGLLRAQEGTLASIIDTLEKSGIEFIGEGDRSITGGVGIRLVQNENVHDWNRKVDEVLTCIPDALHRADIAEIAGTHGLDVEKVEAVMGELLGAAGKRLHRQEASDGGLIDLMMPSEDE